MKTLSFLFGILALSSVTHAQTPTKEPAPNVILLPTLNSNEVSPAALTAQNKLLDQLLADTAQDLGFHLDVSSGSIRTSAHLSETELIQIATQQKVIVVQPRLFPLTESTMKLQIVMVKDSSRVIHSRIEESTQATLARDAVIMMRDLFVDTTHAPPRQPTVFPTNTSNQQTSSGLTILAANATLFGGFAGYSIQRSSGSEDPRLMYPLLAVGAGIGLGGSIIIGEEWNLSEPEAWYLAAGAWWPTAAAHLIYEGRFGVSSENTETEIDNPERFSYGLFGAFGGLTLSAVNMLSASPSEGAAALTHSGGAWGLVFGGLTQWFIEADTATTPFAGMGYGAGLGWLVTSTAGIHLKINPSRVLATDLGGTLGGLSGAALASPFLFEDPTDTDHRIWTSAIAIGAVTGSALGYYLARKDVSPDTAKILQALPQVGIIGESHIGATHEPIFGVTWSKTTF